MSNWINFSILWMLTGSPVSAALILLAAYAIMDWYTFGFLRGVARAVANFRRGRRLRLLLLHNPHDRKARADLGEILLSQRRYARAIEVVKPIADQAPHDLDALFMLGVACLATGRVEQGELFLTEVHHARPDFRDGAPLPPVPCRCSCRSTPTTSRRGSGSRARTSSPAIGRRPPRSVRAAGGSTRPSCPTSSARIGSGPGARGRR